MSVKPALIPASILAVLVGIFAFSQPSPHVGAQEKAQSGDAKSKSLGQGLIGTWKLEAASTPGSPSGIGTRLKMFTGTHWCIIQPDETGLIVFQHGGRYELDGDIMKITRDFAGESTKSLLGGKGKHTIKIDGDTMTQADSEGVFNETWKRVK